MTRKLAALASIPLFVVACGSARTNSAPAASALPLPEGPARAPAAMAPVATNASMMKALPLRAPGDYVVFRFSGKLEKRPITLTERLVSQQDDVTVIDYTVEDGISKKTMRARMVGAGTEQKVASAALMDGEIEGPVPASAVDAFLAKTFVATDANGGALKTEVTALRIGDRVIDCTRTTYKVRVGKRDATMAILASDGLRGRRRRGAPGRGRHAPLQGGARERGQRASRVRGRSADALTTTSSSFAARALPRARARGSGSRRGS